MNKTDKIQIRKYDHFKKCFIPDGVGSYEIDYLLNLLDEANDWHEEVLEGHTAVEILASLAYHLDVAVEYREALYNVFEIVRNAAEVERNS